MSHPEQHVTESEVVPDYITAEMADSVTKQLEKISVRLEVDPTIHGASYIHSMLKECRDFSIEVETLLIKYYDIERRVKNRLRSQKESLKAYRAELLALDAWVAKGRSTADRTARADMKLKSEVEIFNDLKEQEINVNYILKAIELKLDGLKRTNADIKKQVSLMEFVQNNSGNFDPSVPQGREYLLDEDDDDDVEIDFEAALKVSSDSVDSSLEFTPDDFQTLLDDASLEVDNQAAHTNLVVEEYPLTAGGYPVRSAQINLVDEEYKLVGFDQDIVSKPAQSGPPLDLGTYFEKHTRVQQ